MILEKSGKHSIIKAWRIMLLESAFDSYFHFFPFNDLKDAEGFDMGCGSGRWAQVCC